MLKSLEGAPKKIGNDFICSNCGLTSLEGGPETVVGAYECNNCEDLESLNGVAKEIKGDFYCVGCDKLKRSDILRVNARDVFYN